MPDPAVTRAALEAQQLSTLRILLAAVLPANPFYAGRLAAAGVTADFADLDEFRARVPFTTKAEIVADQRAHPPYGTNLTFPLEHYTRCHQTSGSTGTPLRWLDTPGSWTWMLDNWERVHRAAGTTKEDRIFFAFSFGPFLGFWTAFESALRIGCLTLPGGGMTSHARLRTIIELKATVLCCTPTYAIRLAEVAAEENIDLRDSPVKTLSVAGEPGGSIPAVRQELQKLWPGARVYDHHGMTEVGPVSYEDPEHPCTLRVMENAYLAEVIDPATLKPVVPGATGELVLTTLGRTGSPMLRYRTGDLVKPSQLPGENHFLALEGGILGRVDDMAVVRGVNVYPGAVEEIIRRVGGVVEYRVHVTRARAMTELAIEVEPAADVSDAAGLARRVEQALQSSLTLRIPVRAVASGALHRFEMKARRWIQEP